MAMAPPRPCAHPSCARLNCAQHQVPAWRTQHGPPPPRIRGRQLQRLRARLFSLHPWCVHCLTRNLTRRATIRDHVIPLAEGGRDDETNAQALCLDCSNVKTAAESKRGVRRR